MGIVQAKALVDLRIGPELRALPQLDAGGQRDIESLLGLRPAGETVGSFKRRVERGIGLLDERRLPMHRENIACADEARWREGCRSRRIVEAVVEADAELMFR